MTNTKYPQLFSSFKLRHVTLRNRIVAPPMLQLRSIISPEGIAWYRRLAAGGAGLVIVEVTSVRRFGTELTAQTLAPLVKAIHDHGAAAAIQLFPIQFFQSADPTTLSLEEIQKIVELYASAARICQDAGFDGVEPHGAHGYLINQFFMPDVNNRSDAFGGSLDARCQFALRIVRAMRTAISPEMLLFYRHTPVGNAYTVEDSLHLASLLVDAGVDVLDISPARQDGVADLAAPFKAKFPKTPVIAVKGMSDPAAAEEALANNRCDLCAIGRALIADAQLPNKVLHGREEDILRCTECNLGCFGHIKTGEPVTCQQWYTDEVRPFVL